MAVEVPQTQRLLDVAEVLEEHHPFGQVREPPVLFRGQPGGYKVLYLPRLIQQGDDAVAGAGQGAGAVQHPLEHRVEVEALVDAQAGLAEAGQPVAKLRLSHAEARLPVPFPPSNRAADGHEPPVAAARCRMRDSGREPPGQPPNYSWSRKNSQRIRLKKS